MALYRCTGGNSGPKVSTGVFTMSTSGNTVIDLGFKPKYLCVTNKQTGSTKYAINVYNPDIEGDNNAYYADNSNTTQKYSLPSTTSYHINSITNNGFIMNKISQSVWEDAWYFAIG